MGFPTNILKKRLNKICYISFLEIYKRYTSHHRWSCETLVAPEMAHALINNLNLNLLTALYYTVLYYTLI